MKFEVANFACFGAVKPDAVYRDAAAMTICVSLHTDSLPLIPAPAFTMQVEAGGACVHLVVLLGAEHGAHGLVAGLFAAILHVPGAARLR